MTPSGKSTATASNAQSGFQQPLEGPISLLWAYQLRREHALLLARIEGHTDYARKEDLTIQIESLQNRLKDSNEQIESHEVDFQAIKRRLTAVETRVKSQSHEFPAIRGRVSEIEAEQQKVASTITPGARIKAQEDQIQQLEGKLRELEDQVTKLAEKEVAVVKDSIENLSPPIIRGPRTVEDSIESIPQPYFKKPQLVRNSNVSKKLDHTRTKAFSNADDLLQEVEEEQDSNLRTLHPFQREDTVSTDFDLDAPVTTISYARDLRRARVQADSMSMLREIPFPVQHQLSMNSEHPEFQQGHAQLWAAYLGQGRDLFRRKEDAIVHAFVAGIADPGLRANCEHWLDDRTWSWENIENFPVKSEHIETSPEPASTAELSPATKRIDELGVPRKGDSQAVSKELFRLLEDQGSRRIEPVATYLSPQLDGNRRSQRIAKKLDTVPQQVHEIQHTGPAKLRVQRLEKEREEPSKESQIRRNIRVNNPKSLAPVHLQPRDTKATRSEQTVVRSRASTSNTSPTREVVNPDTPTKLGHAQKRDFRLEDISDQDLRENLRKMHEIFPGEPLRLCQEALVATQGNYEVACRLLINRRGQSRKLKGKGASKQLNSKKSSVLLSTKSPSLGEAAQSSPSPKTPEDQMPIGHVSYKRKGNMSKQEQILSRKRARLVDKKRGPAPPIPILPWSNTDSN